MIPLNIHHNSYGQQTYAIQFSDKVDAVVLNPNIAETINIPTGANFVLFSSNEDFWARADATAVIPITDINDGSSPELNPVARYITGHSTLSLIAPYFTVVTLAWYS